MTVPTGINPREALDVAAEPAASTNVDAQAATLDDKAVAAWLRKHPAFFHNHAELLLELSIPHESGKAISLLERQVAVFRERQGHLQDQIHEFISNARDNDNLFENTRLVVLELLRCTTLSELLQLVSEKLSADFAASASALVFVSDQQHSATAPIRRLPTAEVKAALGDLFAKQRTYCGALNDAQQSLLFAGQPEPIVSAAIVPLHLPEESTIRSHCGLPLLLIGSTQEQHFNSSLDTLFLDFIGEVLSVHLQKIEL